MIVAVCRDGANPKGYREWHEWADAQERRGAKQVKCVACLRWRYRSERCEHFKAAVEDPA